MIAGNSPVAYGRGNLKICRRGKEGTILLAALHRPLTMNAFNDDLYEDLIDLMTETAADDRIAALVLTGAGKYFSSGADLKNGMFEPESGVGRRTLEKPAGRFMMAMITYPKLIAAAVNGPAVGIGVTLLLHCDIIHCSPTATFWAPFTRLALVPELCSSVTFRETMGQSKANELLLLGRRIDAKTALDWNLCSRIVEDDKSNDPFRATSLAGRMCHELDRNLLSLPLGNRTATYFVNLVRDPSRRSVLQDVCQRELLQLDERFDSGQVQVAARTLKIGSSAKQQTTAQSRL
jgi:enoyl-CoA hydratase/carnithine racemase